MDSSEDANSSFEEQSLEQLLAQRKQLMQELIQGQDSGATDQSHNQIDEPNQGSDAVDGPTILKRMRSLSYDRLSPICHSRKRKLEREESPGLHKFYKTSGVQDVSVGDDKTPSSCPHSSSSDVIPRSLVSVDVQYESDNDRSNGSINSASEQMVQEISTNAEELAEEPEADDESEVDIEELLEEPYSACTSNRPNGAKRPIPKEKLVLKYRNTEYFEVLPNGWKEISHRSGLPVYLHLQSRVCTFGRPYFIGPGSVRNHDVPLAAIPCLHQSKIKEETLKRRERIQTDDTVKNLEILGVPDTQVQTLDEFVKRHLQPEQLSEYAKSKFEFETLKIRRFDKWSEQRNHLNWVKGKVEATEQLVGRPTLSSSVKLITVPYMDHSSKPRNRQFFLNPQGKTSIAVLHEYVQKVLKAHIMYEFGEISSAAKPYSATVKVSSKNSKDSSVNGCALPDTMAKKQTNNYKSKDDKTESQELNWVSLGTGYGNSKKVAKMDAARQALAVLVPGIEFNEDGLAKDGDNADSAIKIFDMISVTDTRVPELSAKAGQPPPFLILQECLKRNAAFGDTNVDTKVSRLKHQKHEFKMTCGKHSVDVVCSNKKDGKQKASQAMLQKLHPHVTCWGALIRLYGYDAQKKVIDCRKQKDSIIKLQASSKAESALCQPNEAILDKLKQEMEKQFKGDKPNCSGLHLGMTPVKIQRTRNVDNAHLVHNIDI